MNGNNGKKFENANEKLNSTKVYLETKIEAAMAIEEKFTSLKEEVKHLNEVLLRTKQELTNEVADVKVEMSKGE